MEKIAALIQRALMGDSEAYGVIVGRFQDMAYGYAYAILGDFDLAQDATQEAFIEAYQCLPNLRQAFAFPSWLKRIVYKHCDRLRRGRRLVAAPLEDAAEIASPLPGPAETAERRELARRVQNAVSELPVHQRVVTTLFYIDGYSHQDIAEFLAVPAKTVKSRLHASRRRLRERMTDTVGDELRANALSADFTQETVEQAVARSQALNKEHRYDQAEELLGKVLKQAPQHAGALKELNHALVQGRVYHQGRFEMLPELAERGRAILQATDDDYIHHELARTLLAIPAMPEAVAFLEGWIARKGTDIERTGMLAWAKGCVADDAAAEVLWQEVLALARNADPDQTLFHVPFVAFTLVDCFAASDELARAQRVAREAWERCHQLSPTSPEVAAQLRHHRGFPADSGWMVIFHRAQLEVEEIAQALLARCKADPSPEGRAVVLCIRGWVDEPQAVIADWLDWVRGRIALGDYRMLDSFRFSITRGFGARLDSTTYGQLAQATWDLLGQARTEEAERQRGWWDMVRFPAHVAIEVGDWAAAEDILRRDIAERGDGAEMCWAVDLAAIRGVPTPPEVVQAIKRKGVDRYDVTDWYVVAREAAAAGDEAKAFDALRKALSCWTNPPYAYMERWENDSHWGELRNHAEFKAAFEEKRRRIGPVYGELHYFPGW